MMKEIEILDTKCKTFDSLIPSVTACISYKQNNKTHYLVNSSFVEDELQSEIYISDDYALYYILSSDMTDISDYDLELLDELRAKARIPESTEEIKLAKMSKDLVRKLCIELNYLDEDDEAPGDEFLCN